MEATVTSEWSTAEQHVFAEIEQMQQILAADGLPKFSDEISNRIARHRGLQMKGIEMLY